MSSVSPDVLEKKKHIALAAKYVVSQTRDMTLVPAAILGASYPYAPDVPGVWVRGPDGNGRYSVELHVAVESLAPGVSLIDESGRLRAAVWSELRARGIAQDVDSVDIFVEDIDIAV